MRSLKSGLKAQRTKKYINVSHLHVQLVSGKFSLKNELHVFFGNEIVRSPFPNFQISQFNYVNIHLSFILCQWKLKPFFLFSGGYDNLNYPAPSFVNPIPWKPIHIPQHDRTPKKNSTHRKQPGPPKYRSTPCLAYKPKETISFASKRW